MNAWLSAYPYKYIHVEKMHTVCCIIMCTITTGHRVHVYVYLALHRELGRQVKAITKVYHQEVVH